MEFIDNFMRSKLTLFCSVTESMSALTTTLCPCSRRKLGLAPTKPARASSTALAGLLISFLLIYNTCD